MERTGIFVGSFDPFTIGHDSVVRRAVKMFDKLVITIGFLFCVQAGVAEGGEYP